MKNSIQKRIALVGIASALLSGTCWAGLYGNDTAATARPILADGTTYTDQMTATNTDAWFVFRADPNQSYSIEVWNPYGKRQVNGNRCTDITGVYESDGTTLITTINRYKDHPAPQLDLGLVQGGRETFINLGIARPVTIHVYETGAAPATPTDCAARVVTTTLASARWSVNGYQDIIAISNVASIDAGSPSISGSVLYFDEAGTLVGSDPFTLAANASVQIVKPNGVLIGGANRGGIRIVHDGAPGAILAHQLWYNPVTNAYIQYPFVPLVHSYGRGGI